MSEVIKLIVVFFLMVVILRFTKLLPLAIGCAAIAVIPLFGLDPLNSIKIAGKAIISPLTVQTACAFYFITFLQRILEKRGKLIRAQEALNGIFNNRRINASLASVIVGMLPAAGVVTIAGAMVDKAVGDYLTTEEKCFTATYYRHVTEAFLPTYMSVIIGTELAGVSLSSFLIGVIPVVILIVTLGFVFYLRKVPKDTGGLPSTNKGKDVLVFFKSIWTLVAVVIVVIVFKIPVFIPVVAVTIIAIFIDRLTMTELKPMFVSAFEKKLILSTVVIMIFKDLLIAARVITVLPEVFGRLPLPSFLVYTLIVFFGTLVSGQQAINVVVLPMAFTAGSGAGFPLFILLMAAGYASMQISPTHICLAIAADYFKVSMGSLVKKTLPVIMTLLVLVVGYYLLLIQIF